jgi:hypothetical protein
MKAHTKNTTGRAVNWNIGKPAWYVRLPRLDPGNARTFQRCKSCGAACWKDYLPYSLQNPIMTLPCNCLITSHPSNHLEDITEREAQGLWARARKKAEQVSP